jgi:uncharacterized protein (DUF2384 family)
MTFQDERTSRDGQRIDHLAEWLEVTLGPRLVAYAVGVSPAEICRYAHGESPEGEVETRLRNLYTATWFIASTDGPGTAHDWLVEPNPTLENRTPAELLRNGESPAPAWFDVARVY